MIDLRDKLPGGVRWRLDRAAEWRRSLPDAAKAKRLASVYRIAGRYKRIYFWHIRKTGGISLSSAMLGVACEDGATALRQLADAHGRLILGDKVFVGWNVYLIEQGHYYYGFSHMPMHRITLPPETYTITCLRDPVKRVVSDYRMAKERAKSETTATFKRRYGGRVGSLTEYFTQSPRKDLLRQIYMFSESLSVDEAAERIAGCNRFFFTNELSDAIVRLGEELGEPLQSKHENKGKAPVEIDQAELDDLREMLEPEYRLFEQLQKFRNEAGMGNVA
jgi:hypothetical protein